MNRYNFLKTATTASTDTWSGTFGYAGAFGYQEDSDSSLKLLGNRYYDASLGRFISRDPIKDGNNWYSYCGGNPVSNADPEGNVKIEVVWYEVTMGAYHSGLLIIDKVNRAKQPLASFSGGPEHYIDYVEILLTPWNYHAYDAGNLISRSGMWSQGEWLQDRAKLGGNWWKGRQAVMIVDDGSSAVDWVSKFQAIEAKMKSKGEFGYDPIPAEDDATGNSNSWCRELLEESGLITSYDKAIGKKGGAPWVPGWLSDPWGD